MKKSPKNVSIAGKKYLGLRTKSPTLYAAIYFKNNKPYWYNGSSLYRIKNEKDEQSIIEEVHEEMRAKRENIHLYSIKNIVLEKK